MSQLQVDQAICILQDFHRDSGNLENKIFAFFYSLPLKKGPIVCPETSVTNYHYLLRINTEDLSSPRIILKNIFIS